MSGVGNTDFMIAVWYRREVEVPSAWQGRVACVPESGVLAVLNTLDGSTIWRRALDGRPIGSLHIHDGFLLAADDAGLRLQVFDVEDGRWVCDLHFQEPNLPGPTIRLVYADAVKWSGHE